jgi:hypothetical protein
MSEFIIQTWVWVWENSLLYRGNSLLCYFQQLSSLFCHINLLVRHSVYPFYFMFRCGWRGGVNHWNWRNRLRKREFKLPCFILFYLIPFFSQNLWHILPSHSIISRSSHFISSSLPWSPFVCHSLISSFLFQQVDEFCSFYITFRDLSWEISQTDGNVEIRLLAFSLSSEISYFICPPQSRLFWRSPVWLISLHVLFNVS